MEYGHLGRTNLTVSRICLGTMHFGRVTSEEESFAIMDRALEMGINFFDTANVYGSPTGRTEEVIGRWMAQGGGRRGRIVLATKVFGDMVRDREVPNEERGISVYKVRKHLEDSLRRLSTDHVDLYQVHHIDRRITEDEFWNAFVPPIERGDVGYLGTSNFPGWGLAKYQMSARQRGLLGIVSEQSMYNLLCRAPELEVIPAAREFGIGLIPYMPLAGGLLTGKKVAEAGSRTASVSKEYGIPLDQNRQLEAFSELCREMGEKEHVVATAWVLANPGVSSAIVGVRTLAHLDDMERIASLRLPADVMKRLDAIFDINDGRRLRSGAEAPEAYAW
jgi:aryl-alcohol dehydrogenase-like predicted oxidoreductase